MDHLALLREIVNANPVRLVAFSRLMQLLRVSGEPGVTEDLPIIFAGTEERFAKSDFDLLDQYTTWMNKMGMLMDIEKAQKEISLKRKAYEEANRLSSHVRQDNADL